MSEYRNFTGDFDSFDGDVNNALVEAQAEVERFTNRKFELQEDTETLPVYGGMVYPSRTPVVSTSTGSVVGDAIQWGYYGWDYTNPVDDYSYGYGDLRVFGPTGYTTVTYVGGYSEDEMPTKLKRIVARIAKSLLKAASNTGIDFSQYPAGTTSVRTLDQSITGKNLTSAPSIDPLILSELRSWRRPEL